jgi:hypothetical protein
MAKLEAKKRSGGKFTAEEQNRRQLLMPFVTAGEED